MAAKEDEYAEAMMDGDKAKATAIRMEINQHIHLAARAEAESVVEQRYQAQSLNAVAAKAVEDFPFLGTPEGEDAMDAIVALRDSKMRSGMSAAQALSEAVQKIAPRFAPAPVPAANGQTPGMGSTSDTKPKETRTAIALARGAADSAAQPPAVQAGIGNRTTGASPNVEQMDDEQFARLSAAEKKKLRGD